MPLKDGIGIEMLHCDRFQIQTMVEQAQQAYPQECCGLLLGQKRGDDRYCRKIWPTANAWAPDIAQDFRLELAAESLYHSQADRYWIDPQDLLTAQKWGREHGQIILGIYHSHPNHPAIPSERDRHWAWSSYAYLILSIQQDQLLDYRCWQLNEIGQFEPEGLLVPAL
ncbi:MAG: M67 family metallopeptidase [Prochlorotrichaceae cyanobacterium]